MKRYSLLLVLVFTGLLSAAETTYVKSTDTYKRIKEAIEKIRPVDVHEHLVPEKDLLKDGPLDFFTLMGDYRGAEDKRYLDKTLSVKKRWASFLPVYEGIKNRGYVNSVRAGVRKLYGIEISDAASIKKINARMKKMYRPGVFRRALYKIGKLDYVFVQARWEGGFPAKDYPDFFRGGRALDKMTTFNEQEDIRWIEGQFDISIHSVDDLERVYEKYVEESIASGAIGFKYSGAYLRPLDFTKPSREKADALLRKLLQLTEAEFSWAGGEAFGLQDGMELSTHLMHLMLSKIEQKKLPVAFHTGIVGGGNTRTSDPQLLIPLFREYKNINFELYHSGFPYVVKFVELGKSWPNVYLNMCWAQNLSPTMARRQLSEMLECVPVNKIIAFGGDSRSMENIIGDLEITKENCAIVLAEKVLDGYFSEAEAIVYAERILRTNAIELYNLEGKRN